MSLNNNEKYNWDDKFVWGDQCKYDDGFHWSDQPAIHSNSEFNEEEVENHAVIGEIEVEKVEEDFE